MPPTASPLPASLLPASPFLESAGKHPLMSLLNENGLVNIGIWILSHGTEDQKAMVRGSLYMQLDK